MARLWAFKVAGKLVQLIGMYCYASYYLPLYLKSKIILLIPYFEVIWCHHVTTTHTHCVGIKWAVSGDFPWAMTSKRKWCVCAGLVKALCPLLKAAVRERVGVVVLEQTEWYQSSVKFCQSICNTENCHCVNILSWTEWSGALLGPDSAMEKSHFYWGKTAFSGHQLK